MVVVMVVVVMVVVVMVVIAVVVMAVVVMAVVVMAVVVMAVLLLQYCRRRHNNSQFVLCTVPSPLFFAAGAGADAAGADVVADAAVVFPMMLI